MKDGRNNLNDDVVEIQPLLLIDNVDTFTILLQEVEAPHRELHIPLTDREAGDVFTIMNDLTLESNLPDSTYSLLLNTLESYNVNITGFIINDFIDGEWVGTFETINITTHEQSHIEARISDLICLSVLSNIPILIFDNLLNKYKSNTKVTQDTPSLEELNNKLKTHIKNEEYELANEIKNEINERSSK